MRNLGGAIGIAVVNTWLLDNARIETARIGETLGHSAHAASDAVARLADRLAAATPDPAQALLLARGLLGQAVGQQSLSLAFDDVFRLMAWLFAAALVMVPFARAPARAPSAPDVH
jgi:DHA2 family multidrug resistance protein